MRKIKMTVILWVIYFDFLVKGIILDKMQMEPEELVRRAICGVVSVLAAHLLKLGQWPEILDRMNTVIIELFNSL